MKEILINITLFANYFALVYILSINFLYFLQLILASFSLGSYIKKIKYSDYKRYSNSSNMVPLSLLVPAYNEDKTIINNVKSMLNLDYPEYEVIVINDGSNDNTLKLLIEEFNLSKTNQPFKRVLKTENINAIYRNVDIPNLIVIDKDNGGKSDALNAGINVSTYPVYAGVDADSLLESESLLRLMMPIIEDNSVIAVGGIVRIATGCKFKDGKLIEINVPKNSINRFQVVEYLRAFLTGRMGFDSANMLLIISGAFGAFNKQIVIDAGGYTVNCIGEDMELVIRMHKVMMKNKLKYKIKFIPDPVCWTQAPSTFKDLKTQRKRWYMGLMSSLFNNKDMLFRYKYKQIGLISIPYFWIFEFFGPVIETIGYILVPVSFILGIINIKFMITFYILAILYGVMLSIGSLLLEEHTFKKYPKAKQIFILTIYSILDNFGYRHLNNIFKIEALFSYKKNKHKWGNIKRTEFEEA